MNINPINSLNDYIKGNRKSSINETIASYFIIHYFKIPEMIITEIADACCVSTPSIIRFCREIGYLNFSDFKERVKESIETIPIDVSESQLMRTVDDKDSVLNWLKLMNNSIRGSVSDLEYEKAEHLAKDIMNYKNVYFYGSSLSGLICDYLRILLFRNHKSVVTLDKPNIDVPLTNDKEDTLIVVVSQHNHYFQSHGDYLTYFKKNSDKLWLITQSQLNEKAYQVFDDILYAKASQDALMDYHIMLFVIQIIAAYCNVKKE